MDGLDLVILAIASTAAIFMVGFAAKVYCILRKDWNRGQSILELDPKVAEAAEFPNKMRTESSEVGPALPPGESVNGHTVVRYCDPMTTKDLKSSRFPEG